MEDDHEDDHNLPPALPHGPGVHEVEHVHGHPSHNHFQSGQGTTEDMIQNLHKMVPALLEQLMDMQEDASEDSENPDHPSSSPSSSSPQPPPRVGPIPSPRSTAIAHAAAARREREFAIKKLRSMGIEVSMPPSVIAQDAKDALREERMGRRVPIMLAVSPLLQKGTPQFKKIGNFKFNPDGRVTMTKVSEIKKETAKEPQASPVPTLGSTSVQAEAPGVVAESNEPEGKVEAKVEAKTEEQAKVEAKIEEQAKVEELKVEAPEVVKAELKEEAAEAKEPEPVPESIFTTHYWDSLVGCDRVKVFIEAGVLLPLQYPDVFKQLTDLTFQHPTTTAMPSAVLFEGPPGTGKTAMARAIAERAQVPFVNVSLSNILSKWYGDTENRINAIFAATRNLGPKSLLFFDEIDSIGGERHDRQRGHGTLSSFLVAIDGLRLSKDPGTITFIGATNTKGLLDAALLSRFGVIVDFPVPNSRERAEIFAVYAKHLSTEERRALGIVAEGMSGRDIKNVCAQTNRTWGTHLLTRGREKGSTSVTVPAVIELPPVSVYLREIEQYASAHPELKVPKHAVPPHDDN